jgi:hypothetical protein
MDAKGEATMTNTEEPTSTEYADQLIEAYRLADETSDPEWRYEDRITFMVDELVTFCARTSGVDRRHFNRLSLDRLARERLGAARA